MSTRGPQDDIVPIAVMGPTGSGKSRFINVASGANLNVGDGLRSCTMGIEVSPVFEAYGRRVVLIDTPGFDDTTRSDTDILKLIAIYMSATYEGGQMLKGIIYMHRITDVRMGGITRRNFSMFRKLCGDETLGNVVIVTNMWGEVAFERGLAREQELASDDILFRPVLQGGARMMRHQTNTRGSAHQILKYFFDKPEQILRIQRELVDEHKDIAETAAGVELDRELAEVQRKHKEELREIQKEMAEAIRTKDDQTKQELEQVRRQLESEMNRVENDRQRLSSEYAEEKRKMDDAMQELRQRLQAEEAQREQRQIELRNLQAQFEHAAHTSQAERQMLQQHIRELQDSIRKRKRSGWSDVLGVVGVVCRGLVSAYMGPVGAMMSW